MDGSSFIQQRCFVHAQNSPSTDVHGCTAVEDGSNGLTASLFCDSYLYLPDAFTLLTEKKLAVSLLKIDDAVDVSSIFKRRMIDGKEVSSYNK